ncbi:hypothetical protein QJS04_geneDACA016284 [Acorus gramineus]|uniref:Prolactin receptor n=1 Tax=Acorus gramineus TaxID=55184 RepID=A0AAV9A1D1_ACOGR|nr:hypothetical protein QJS04_geneDACA016284 [Acorus gramineus]
MLMASHSQDPKRERCSATGAMPQGAPPSDPTQRQLEEKDMRGVSHTLSEWYNPCNTTHI